MNEETGKTRLEDITDDVKASLTKYPGYSLYCCGHSLGGSLCTLFGFYISANDEVMAMLDGPVKVYSIASPYVGNWKFRFAFQYLERQKRIQHLRIANLEDMVTLMPFAAPKLTALSPALSLIKGAGNLYKHCGMRLQLTAPGEGDGLCHEISYPKDHECTDEDEYAKEVNDSMAAGKSLASAFGYAIRQDFDTLVKFHSCEEYEFRLEKSKSILTTVTLDQLYADKKLVGDILNLDYEPKKMDSGMSRAKRAFSHFRKRASKRDSSSSSEMGEEETEKESETVE